MATREELLLDRSNGLLWPLNFIFDWFISPLSNPPVTEVLKTGILLSQLVNKLRVVRLPNLLPSCHINHWPKCWRLPVNSLVGCCITLWKCIFLASLLSLLFLHICYDSLLGCEAAAASDWDGGWISLSDWVAILKLISWLSLKWIFYLLKAVSDLHLVYPGPWSFCDASAERYDYDHVAFDAFSPSTPLIGT